MHRAAGKNWPLAAVPSEIGRAVQGLHERAARAASGPAARHRRRLGRRPTSRPGRAGEQRKAPSADRPESRRAGRREPYHRSSRTGRMRRSTRPDSEYFGRRATGPPARRGATDRGDVSRSAPCRGKASDSTRHADSGASFKKMSVQSLSDVQSMCELSVENCSKIMSKNLKLPELANYRTTSVKLIYSRNKFCN